MKILALKSLFWSVVPACAVFLFLNSVQAEFFLIPLGAKTKKIVLVSPKGTETESGTALLDALNKITDASSTNPYLIAIEPGVYNIGSNALQMISYVDIRGSGKDATTITGDIDSDSDGVIKGKDNAELCDLTVKNTGGGSCAIAVYNNNSSPRITDVTVSASGGASDNYGIYSIGNSSFPIITNVTVTADGGSSICYGIYNDNCTPSLTNVTATAKNGTDATYGICNVDSSAYMMNITAKAEDGSNNIGVYNYSCEPVMKNVTAVADGGSTGNYGVMNNGSSPTMIHVTAEAKNGPTCCGIYNIYTSTPTMTYITATAENSDGENCYGVHNDSGSTVIMNYVNAKAEGGSVENYGVYSSNSATAKIGHSMLSGTDNSVSADSGTHVYIGDTQIEGTVGGDGTYTCTGVFTENFEPCDEVCAVIE